MTSWINEYENSEQKFRDDYALEWESVILALSKEGSGRSNIPALIKSVVPALQASLVELLKVVEKEAAEQEKFRAQLKANPALKPRAQFNPLHWLASHLMRHNPRYGNALPGAENTNIARPNYPISNEDNDWCVQQGLAPEAIKNYQDQFFMLDASHHGRISVASFQKGLASVGIYPDPATLRRMIGLSGGAATGTIGFRDFVQIHLHMQQAIPSGSGSG
jgi:hypothetical protein